MHYLLVKLLEKNGLKYGDVQPVFLPPADARAAFEKGAVDAWVIWDPFLAAAEKQIGARILADGTRRGQQLPVTTSPSAATSTSNPQVIQALFDDSQEQRRAGSRPTSAQAAALIAPLQGLDVDGRRDRACGATRYGVEPLTPAVAAEQQKIADTFFELKLIPKAIRIADALPGNARRPRSERRTMTIAMAAVARAASLQALALGRPSPAWAAAGAAAAARRRRRSCASATRSAPSTSVVAEAAGRAREALARHARCSGSSSRPARSCSRRWRSAASTSASPATRRRCSRRPPARTCCYVGAEPPKPRQLGDPGAGRFAAAHAGRPEGQAHRACRRARARTTCWCARVEKAGLQWSDIHAGLPAAGRCARRLRARRASTPGRSGIRTTPRPSSTSSRACWPPARGLSSNNSFYLASRPLRRAARRSAAGRCSTS